MTVGLALRANPRAPFVRARQRYLQRRRVSNQWTVDFFGMTFVGVRRGTRLIRAA